MKEEEITFKGYLESIYAKIHKGTDDDMIEGFDNWLATMDVGETIEFGELAIKRAHLEGRKLTLKNLTQ